MRIKPAKERLWLYASGAVLLFVGLGLRTIQHPQAAIASFIGLSLIVLGLGLYWRAVVSKDEQGE